VLVQIETELAVENVDEVLAVEGIDGVFVGPTISRRRGLKALARRLDGRRGLHDGSCAAVADAACKAGKCAGFLARDAKMALEVTSSATTSSVISGTSNFHDRGGEARGSTDARVGSRIGASS